MAIAIVRSQSQSFSNNASPSLTMGASPTSNDNILVAACINRADIAVITQPSGWTLLNRNTASESSAMGWCVAWKAANTGDTTIGFSGLISTNDSSIAYVEISGADNTTLEASAENKTNISTNVSTNGTGSATATTANGIAVGIVGIFRSLAGAGGSWDNSFTEQQAVITGNFGGVSLATLIYSSTGSKTANFSWTDTAEESYGTILLFAEAGGGGGGSIIPILNNYYQA